MAPYNGQYYDSPVVSDSETTTLSAAAKHPLPSSVLSSFDNPHLSSSTSEALSQPRMDAKPSDSSQPPDFIFLAHSLDYTTSADHFVPKFLRNKPYAGWLANKLLRSYFAVHHYTVAPLVATLGIVPGWEIDRWDLHVDGRDEPIRTQTLTTWFTTPQYLQDSPYLHFIRQQMMSILQYADESNVKVLGLGALNKAEWVNNGGADLKAAVEPETTRVAHGNTMTAAAVAANVVQIAEGKNLEKKVFLTGSTSKVGAAVAVYLANKGYEVHCCTQSKSRFAQLCAKLPSHAKGSLVMAEKMKNGDEIKLWVIGKNQPAVHDHIPHGGEAVVFAVPDPMRAQRRPDLFITNGAIFELPEGKYTRRGTTAPLRKNELFACHTGCLVHAIKGWTHHELGEVDWTKLDEHLEAAYEVGFRLPALNFTEHDHRPETHQVDSVKRTVSHENVLAALAVTGLAGVTQALVHWQVRGFELSSTVNDVLATILFAVTYALLGAFLYDRHLCHQSKSSSSSAKNVYRLFAYYTANMIVLASVYLSLSCWLGNVAVALPHVSENNTWRSHSLPEEDAFLSEVHGQGTLLSTLTARTLLVGTAGYLCYNYFYPSPKPSRSGKSRR